MALKHLTKPQMKELEKKVGSDLLKRHGKQKYYTPAQVKESCRSTQYPVDWHCWAMCFYTDHSSFDRYHQSIGESCDYTGMKSQMVSALTDGSSDSWSDFDFDLSWIDIPDFDFLSFFD